MALSYLLLAQGGHLELAAGNGALLLNSSFPPPPPAVALIKPGDQLNWFFKFATRFAAFNDPILKNYTLIEVIVSDLLLGSSLIDQAFWCMIVTNFIPIPIAPPLSYLLLAQGSHIELNDGSGALFLNSSSAPSVNYGFVNHPALQMAIDRSAQVRQDSTCVIISNLPEDTLSNLQIMIPGSGVHTVWGIH